MFQSPGVGGLLQDHRRAGVRARERRSEAGVAGMQVLAVDIRRDAGEALLSEVAIDHHRVVDVVWAGDRRRRVRQSRRPRRASPAGSTSAAFRFPLVGADVAIENIREGAAVEVGIVAAPLLEHRTIEVDVEDFGMPSRGLAAAGAAGAASSGGVQASAGAPANSGAPVASWVASRPKSTASEVTRTPKGAQGGGFAARPLP